MQIAGSTFVVTGGCGGIGSAVAKHLASQSANVVVLDILEQAKGDSTLASWSDELAEKPRLFYVQADIASQPSCKAAFERILAWCSEVGKLVGLVHCAGIALRRPWTQSAVETIDGFEKMLRVNTLGAYTINAFAADAINSQYVQQDQDALSRSANPESRFYPRVEQERGVIVNFASIAAHDPTGRNLGYGPTKSAVLGLTKTFADYLAPSAIRVNSISPGIVASPMNASGLGWFKRSLDAHAGFPREPTDFTEICNAVSFIIQTKAVNSEDIKITGGWRLVSDWAQGSGDPRETVPGIE